MEQGEFRLDARSLQDSSANLAFSSYAHIVVCGRGIIPLEDQVSTSDAVLDTSIDGRLDGPTACFSDESSIREALGLMPSVGGIAPGVAHIRQVGRPHGADGLFNLCRNLEAYHRVSNRVEATTEKTQEPCRVLFSFGHVRNRVCDGRREPTFNAADLLIDAYPSIQSQRFWRFEAVSCVAKDGQLYQ